MAEVVVDAGASGGTPLAAREGGSAVQRLAARGRVGAVVGWKLDRLFRDAGDCLNVTREWDRRGVALHLADLGGQAVDTSSAMGRFFLTVMAGAAEMERNQVRERTSAALRHKAARGEFTGGEAPYGFRLAADGVRLEEVEAEQRAVREARRPRVRLPLRPPVRRLAGRPDDGGRLNRGYRSSTSRPARPPNEEGSMSRTKSMGETTQLAFRMPTELVERLDRYLERVRARTPGIGITRADVVRNLLTVALDREDAAVNEAPPAPPETATTRKRPTARRIPRNR